MGISVTTLTGPLYGSAWEGLAVSTAMAGTTAVMCAPDISPQASRPATTSLCSKSGMTTCDPIPWTTRTSGVDDTTILPEHQSLNRTITQLEYHEISLKRSLTPREWIMHLKHLQRLIRLGAYEFSFAHPTCELAVIGFAAESVEKSMRYRIPGPRLTELDRGIHALLGDALKRAVPLEEKLLERNAHTPIILNEVGKIHLSFAKRVLYPSFLTNLQFNEATGLLLFNLILLHAMEAVRRFNATGNTLLYGGAITFLEHIKHHMPEPSLKAEAVLAEQNLLLKIFLEEIATAEPEKREEKQTLFMETIDQHMVGLYSFLPALYTRLSSDAERLELWELALTLAAGASAYKRIARKLGLPIQGFEGNA